MSGAAIRGLAAVAATHPGQHVPTTPVAEEYLADAIADVLHLAAESELDPDEVLEHGRRYFAGDLAEPWTGEA